MAQINGLTPAVSPQTLQSQSAAIESLAGHLSGLQINSALEISPLDLSFEGLRLPCGRQKIPSKLELLPREIKACVARFLTAKDAGSLQLSSKLMYSPRSMVSHCKLAPNTVSIQELIDNPNAHFKFRQNVKLPVYITDTQLIKLIERGYLDNVRSLDLSNSLKLTDKGLSHLWKLESLQHLHLSSCQGITDGSMKHICHIKKLQHLNLSRNSQLSGETLNLLSELKHLESLNLSGCRDLGNESLTKVSELQKLQHLDLSWNNRIKDIGMNELSKLTELRSLDVSFFDKISDACILPLIDNTQLQRLNLTGCLQISGLAKEVLRQNDVVVTGR